MSKHWSCLTCNTEINSRRELDAHRKTCEKAVFLGDGEE